MAPIQARSTAEALEYMMLAVPECGDELAIEFVESYREGGEWVDAYVAGCAARGVRREFTFTLDQGPSGGDTRLFGAGPEPSKLIDAGQWYLIFGRYMEAGLTEERRFAPRRPDNESAEAIYAHFARAWAAVVEILRFIPPGAQTPPDAAFWTELGRTARERFGDQLTRSTLESGLARLDNVLRTYREAYAPQQ